jgi:hypothetical protein
VLWVAQSQEIQFPALLNLSGIQIILSRFLPASGNGLITLSGFFVIMRGIRLMADLRRMISRIPE